MKLVLISICIISGALKLTEAEKTPSSESIKLGAFSHEKAVDFLFNKKIIKSLDVLSSLHGQNYNGSDATWLVPFTLFYYNKTVKQTDASALILTLADLFCDDVPVSKRSYDKKAITTVANDLDKFYGYRGELSWTRRTPDDYLQASQSGWRQLSNYFTDYTIENLIEPLEFSLKDPEEWVVRKTRSGLWSIIYAFAFNSVISNDEFREMVVILTKGDRRLDMDKDVIDLARDNLLPVMSNGRLHSIIAHSVPYPVSRALIKKIGNDKWSSRDQIRRLILALKEFPDFPWARLPSTDQLRNHLERLCIETYLGQTREAPSKHFYHYDVANELFVRLNGHSKKTFDDWVEDNIVGYMNGTIRKDPITSEDLLDCIVL